MEASAKRRLLAVAAIGALSVAACGSGGGGDDSTAGGSGGGDDIVVGYIGALSGGSATMGVPGLNGIKLAVEEINAEGGINGRMITLVSYDDQADPATSASAAQRLVSEDNAIAVFGGPNSGTVRANNVILAEAQIPQIITIAQEDTLVDPEGDTFQYTFRTTEPNSYDVGAIASLFKDRGYEAICALADTTAYGEGGLASIRTVFEEHGLTLHSTQQHQVNATDLTSQTLALRDAGCDSVYLYSLAPDGALFLKTTTQVGWDVPVVGGRGLMAKSFLSLGGADATGLVLPGTLDPNKQAGADFVAAYDEMFGADDDPAHTYSSLGYDSMQLLAEALRATEGEGGEALATALESVRIDDAASGREGSYLEFGEDHEAPSENFLVFYEIRDGSYEFLTADVESGS